MKIMTMKIMNIMITMDKNISLTIMIQNVLRNVVTPVPGYLNRQIPTSRILTCVKTPVRPPADIARPAPMRNILGVSGTMLQSAFILISGVMDTQSVTEQRMNPSEMLLVIRNS